jgi:hypothetical protein
MSSRTGLPPLIALRFPDFSANPHRLCTSTPDVLECLSHVYPGPLHRAEDRLTTILITAVVDGQSRDEPF